METSTCQLKKQGFLPGSCLVKVDGKHQPACEATLKYEKGNIQRLITSVHLSRPENNLSIPTKTWITSWPTSTRAQYKIIR